jgi:ribosomal protein S2
MTYLIGSRKGLKERVIKEGIIGKKRNQLVKKDRRGLSRRWPDEFRGNLNGLKYTRKVRYFRKPDHKRKRYIYEGSPLLTSVTPISFISLMRDTCRSLIYSKRSKKKEWERVKRLCIFLRKTKKKRERLSRNTSMIHYYQAYHMKHKIEENLEQNKYGYIYPRWALKDKEETETSSLRRIIFDYLLANSCHIGKRMEARNRLVYPYLLMEEEDCVVFNAYLMIKEIRVMLRMIKLRTFWYERLAVNVPCRYSNEVMTASYRKRARGYYHYYDRWVGGIFSNYRQLYRRGLTLKLVNSVKPYNSASRLRNSLIQLLAVSRVPQMPSIFIGFDIDHWPINEATFLGLFSFMYIDSDYNGECASILIPFNLSPLTIGLMVDLILDAIKDGRKSRLRYVKECVGFGTRYESFITRNNSGIGRSWNEFSGKKLVKKIKVAPWKKLEKDTRWDPWRYWKVQMAELMNRKKGNKVNFKPGTKNRYRFRLK